MCAKHDSGFPRGAIEICLAEGKRTLDKLHFAFFYDEPFTKCQRLIETYLAFAPRGFKSFRMAIPLWLREKLFQKN
jgi:carbamoyltransferase